jgi:hypothetical protein
MQLEKLKCYFFNFKLQFFAKSLIVKEKEDNLNIFKVFIC